MMRTSLAILVERKQTERCTQFFRRYTLNPSLFSTNHQVYDNRPDCSSSSRSESFFASSRATVLDYSYEMFTIKTHPDLTPLHRPFEFSAVPIGYESDYNRLGRKVCSVAILFSYRWTTSMCYRSSPALRLVTLPCLLHRGAPVSTYLCCFLL